MHARLASCVHARVRTTYLPSAPHFIITARPTARFTASMGQVYTKMFTFYRLPIITKPVEYPQPYTRGTSKLAPAPGGWTHGWTCPATTFSAGEPLLARMMVLEATTLSRLVERAGRFLCRCTGAAGGCPTVPDPAVTARCRGSPRYITTSRGGQPGLAAPAPSGLCSQVLYNGRRTDCMLPVRSAI